MNNTAQPKIIWFALLMSIAVYVFLAFVVAGQEEELRKSFWEAFELPIVQILYVLAAMTTFAAFFVPNLVRPKRPAQGSLAPLMPMMIVQWALLEAMTIFGLVAAFISHAPEVIVPAVVVTLAGFFLTFPSDDRLARMANEVSP